MTWPKIPRFDPTQAFNARRTDPDTSHDATTHIRISDKEQVYAAFVEAGAHGLTDRELQQQCPESSLARLESWRKRRSDLARERALVDTQERRDGQIVWRCPHRDRLF